MEQRSELVILQGSFRYLGAHDTQREKCRGLNICGYFVASGIQGGTRKAEQTRAQGHVPLVNSCPFVRKDVA